MLADNFAPKTYTRVVNLQMIISPEAFSGSFTCVACLGVLLFGFFFSFVFFGGWVFNLLLHFKLHFCYDQL